ncbi:hypothetical protein L0664_03710 [Octadecabacter sp. G9-8]|uniref:DUF3299 domain-containing protein n=1 Tax=Octadecabacter dasysiphoniae TaxID=2909341 RepID=A0ABS9CUS4_9RHOB|nr:hypothetical protein [Octadecabacter dasysiphoniae]MCF2870164.1 hypothetical protein [Octadecabacter dasysiphoniae]
MIDLFLPLIIGIGLGIEPPQTQVIAVEPAGVVEEITPLSEGSGDDLTAARAPEPQIATGKFTTALEVRPILGMTKSNWVGVREFDGRDLVYFSHLMAWRCGLWDIRYGINGAPADIVVPMEPCNDAFAQPNVMVDVENFLPYVIYPLGSVESIYIEIVFDDGGMDFAQFQRNEVRIP